MTCSHYQYLHIVRKYSNALIDGFYDWIAYIYGLKGRQLPFNSCHCELAYKNGILQTSVDNNQYTCIGGRLHAFKLITRISYKEDIGPYFQFN